VATVSMTREDMKDNWTSLFWNYVRTIEGCQAFQQKLRLYLQQEDKHFEHLLNWCKKFW